MSLKSNIYSLFQRDGLHDLNSKQVKNIYVHFITDKILFQLFFLNLVIIKTGKKDNWKGKNWA